LVRVEGVGRGPVWMTIAGLNLVTRTGSNKRDGVYTCVAQ
jgi:hypothetical protein